MASKSKDLCVCLIKLSLCFGLLGLILSLCTEGDPAVVIKHKLIKECKHDVCWNNEGLRAGFWLRAFKFPKSKTKVEPTIDHIL